MPFPTSIDGTIRIATRNAPEESIAPVRAAYRDRLVSNEAALIKTTPLGFLFCAGLFRPAILRFMGYNILNFVSSGRIDVVAEGPKLRVSYRLRCTEFLVIVSIIAASSFIAALIGTRDLPYALFGGVLFFFWPFSMIYLIAYLRLSHALRRVVRDNAN